MQNYICITCGVQYAATDSPPTHCLICEDERQWVNHEGQQWTTLPQLTREHKNVIERPEPGLLQIKTHPTFAIGQQAFLVQTQQGNILWDCISLLDEDTINSIHTLGGITAIAISHPHFYSTMVEWSHAFDHAPIYLHYADRDYVMRPDPAIIWWENSTHVLNDSLTLIQCGGHFAGSTVLHWSAGAEGRGALLSGDTVMVTPDRRFVSFMYSYPNCIPLSGEEIQGILKTLQPLSYDRIYSGWHVCQADAQHSVARSAERYLLHINGEMPRKKVKH